MVALTDRAVVAARRAISLTGELSETGGVRVAVHEVEARSAFRLSVVPRPAEDDEVIERCGVRVFLDPVAASLLEDKVLEADLVPGGVEFSFADRVDE